MVSAPSSQVWFVYLLECENGRLYTGITPDLAERFRKHATGKGAMFTRLNKPSRMIAAQPCADRSEASKLERTIKDRLFALPEFTCFLGGLGQVTHVAVPLKIRSGSKGAFKNAHCPDFKVSRQDMGTV